MAWVRRYGFYIIIATAVIAVLAVLAGHWFWTLGGANAYLIATGVGSIGALLSSAIALIIANDSTRRAEVSEAAAAKDRGQAEKRQEELRLENERKEELLRRRLEEREDQVRQITVRPVITVKWSWTPERIYFMVVNDAAHVAQGLIFALSACADDGPNVSLVMGRGGSGLTPQPEFGTTLRPFLPIPAAPAKPDVLIYETTGSHIAPDSAWHLACIYDDPLGGHWTHRTTFSISVPAGGTPQWIPLGPAVLRVTKSVSTTVDTRSGSG